MMGFSSGAGQEGSALLLWIDLNNKLPSSTCTFVFIFRVMRTNSAQRNNEPSRFFGRGGSVSDRQSFDL